MGYNSRFPRSEKKLSILTWRLTYSLECIPCEWYGVSSEGFNSDLLVRHRRGSHLTKRTAYEIAQLGGKYCSPSALFRVAELGITTRMLGIHMSTLMIVTQREAETMMVILLKVQLFFPDGSYVNIHGQTRRSFHLEWRLSQTKSMISDCAWDVICTSKIAFHWDFSLAHTGKLAS